MNDAFVMGKLKGIANLRDNLQGFARGKFPGAFQLAQVQSIHKFHDEEGQAIHLAEVMDGDNIWVGQPRERPGLTIETFAKSRTGRRLWRENLQSDKPIERRLACLIDCAHSAFAD